MAEAQNVVGAQISNEGLQGYINALKSQRQAAWDDAAMLAAQLAQAQARIRELENGHAKPADPAPAA